MLDFIYIGLIYVAALLGLILVKKERNSAYRFLTIFLCVTFINEAICWFLKRKVHLNTNQFYNIYYYFRFPVAGLMYSYILKGRVSIFIIRMFWVFSGVMLFVNVGWLYGFLVKHTNYLLAGGIFFIVLAMLHFYQILQNTKKQNPFTTEFFWVSTGFFFYFLGMLPFYGIFNLLLAIDEIFVEDYLTIVKLLSIFLYTSIAIDIIIQWKNLKLKH